MPSSAIFGTSCRQTDFASDDNQLAFSVFVLLLFLLFRSLCGALSAMNDEA